MVGLPAARITDMHICPMVTGIVPHVGGPIVAGSPNVITVKMPQARILDMETCVGPPDTIAQGEITVLTNGLPTARLFHMSTHGGPIITGAWTVLIGSSAPPGQGTINMKLAPNQTPEFAKALQTALSKILPTPSGQELMAQMAKNGKTFTFKETTDANGYCSADNAAAMSAPPGSNSTISWNPNHHTTDSSLPGKQGAPGSEIILAHEMVHGLHNANGDNRNGPNDSFPGQSGSSSRNEERSTVGTSGPIKHPDGTTGNPAPDYSKDVPTENSFRKDLGVPPRPSYYPQNWPGGAPW